MPRRDACNKIVVSFLPFLGVATVYAKFDEIRSCSTIGVADLFENNGLTWEANLKKKCPLFLESFDCVDDFSVRETGNTVFENFKFLQKEGILNSEESALVFFQKTVRDVCTPGTILHEAYLKQDECISSLKTPWKSCRQEALQSFEELEKLFEDEDEELTPSMKQCFLEVYKASCFNTLIETKCGNVPGKIFKDLVQKSKYLGIVCEPEEADDVLEILRSRKASHITFDLKHFT
ncbi:uncharacterized protein LOC129224219 [Uloborus diversus]|uniref:uncharacterized protein LOC129224219 n=1 Tax=Uloborus diversus TaxID=327109 RepID=UPI00240A8635|nr:uncharacterized protein LOC129224219 [Uloborus diversus]